MESEAVTRRLIAGLLACCCFAIACNRGANDVTATWRIEPTPPVTGKPTLVRVTLARDGGQPVADATLRLEAHMSHPGMAPVTADVTEHGNGTYEARLQLAMAGDWVFVMTGELSNGQRMMKEIKVRAVQSAE